MNFGFETLEIVIGLVFVYLLFSIFLTLIVEYISAIFKLRAKNLRKIIERVLDDDETLDAEGKQSKMSQMFYKHPLIKYLSKKPKGIPSYISSDKFAKTVLDLIRTGGQLDKLGEMSSLDNQAKISDRIDELPMVDPDTKAVLKTFAKEANEDINAFGIRLETWFNETVERGQGWFNREIKRITLLIAFIIASIANVDSIRIYKQLSENSDVRVSIADGASNYVKNNEAPSKTTNSTSVESAKEKLTTFYTDKLDPNTNMLNIGWTADYGKALSATNWGYLGISLLGWIITALAISLGAPFWFGLLNKLVALRSAGKGNVDAKATDRNNNQVDNPQTT